MNHMHYIEAIPTLAAFLIFVFLGFLVIHNQHQLTNKLFIVFAAADLLWLGSVFAINFTPIGGDTLLGRFAFAIAIALMMSVQSFLDVLLHIRHSRLYYGFMYGCGAVVLGLTVGTNLIIAGVSIHKGSANLAPFPRYGTFYPLFLVYLVPALAIYFLNLFRRGVKLRHDKIAKKQIDVVSIGLALFASASLLTNLVLPTLATNPWPSQFAPLGSIMLALAFFYAIGRYRLFDVHFFVVRAGTYLLSLFSLSLLCITPIVLLSARILHVSLSADRIVTIVFLGGCILALLQYLRQFFDKVTNHIFFRHYYDSQDILDRLSSVLVRTADMHTLRKDTETILGSALKATVRYVLYVDEDRGDARLAKKLILYSETSGTNIIDTDELHDEKILNSLKEQDITLALRLRTTHEDLGFMLLGHKQSGEIYSSRDRRLLSIAADNIAISLQNALRFKEIQQFNTTLQEKINDATRKLRRSNQKLQELDETKDDFISMASHQLRTPLTSVKGYLSMVIDGDAGKLNDVQAKMLRQAFTSSQRMVFLITDLLNISRLKTGKFVIDAAPVDLSVLAQEEVEQLQETAEVKQIKITYTKPATFPKLMLDEVKTRQVVMNFIDNAIYYTPNGGTIHVELAEKPSSVELRVTDTGMGVPRSEQPHLFTKFYRATNARKARPDGTGLGLFMAKKAVTAQGGSIIFSSHEGHGSTFGFLFSKNKLRVTK